MGTKEKAAAARLGRGLFSLGISVGLGYLTQQPALIVLSPVLNALAKWLRDTFNLNNIPL